MSRTTGGPRFYSTKQSPSDFLGQIMSLLSEYGCDSYMVEQKAGKPEAVAFQWDGLAYRIRPNVAGIAERLEEAGKGRVDPEAVAWAQARHLLEMQLEAIESGAGRASEVLGGYVLVETGRTVGDMIEERAGELLPGERLLLAPGGGS